MIKVSQFILCFVGSPMFTSFSWIALKRSMDTCYTHIVTLEYIRLCCIIYIYMSTSRSRKSSELQPIGHWIPFTGKIQTKPPRFLMVKNPWISCRFSLQPVPGLGISPPRRLLICATTGRGLCKGIGRLAARSNQEWRTGCQRKMVIFHGISWDIVAIYSWITQNQIYMDDFPKRVWYDPFFFRKSRIFTGFLIYPLLGKFPMLGGWPSARFRLWNPGINGAINDH